MAATGVVEEWIPAFAGMTKEKKGHALALGAERGESTGRGDLDLWILGRSGRAMDDTRPSLMAHEIAEDRPAAAPADPLDIPMPPRLETPQGTLCAAPPPGSRIGEPANDRTAAPGISKKIVCDLLRLADFATILGACMASYWIYLRDAMPIGAFLAYGAAAALAATYVFGRLGLYGFERLRNLTWQVSKLALGWSMVLMLGLAAAFLTKTSTDLSRGWFLIWFVSALAAMLLARGWLKVAVERWARQGRLARHVLIVGAGAAATRLAERLAEPGADHVNVVGLFHADLAPGAGCPSGYLGGLADVPAMVRRRHIDEIVIALPGADADADADVNGRRMGAVLAALVALPVDLRFALDFPAESLPLRRVSLQGRAILAHVADRPMTHWSGVAKRATDLVLCLAALAVCALPMAAIALLIRLDSPGPALFRQKRYGYNSKLIVIYKFRTLRAEATDAHATRLVTAGDDRVTRVGRVLRRLSLDELPQLFNVLGGDMAIVGPRPHATLAKAAGRLYDEVAANYMARHRVRPGITGWAQVNGWRGETDTEEKLHRRVEHDLYYIENWSVWFDLKIILRTALTLFRGERAY